MRIIEHGHTNNMPTTKASVHNMICEEMEQNYHYYHGIDDDVMVTAYISSRLHLSTPICRNFDAVEAHIENFNKYLDENDSLFTLKFDDEGYTTTIKFKTHQNPACWEKEATGFGIPQCWAECDLYAQLIY